MSGFPLRRRADAPIFGDEAKALRAEVEYLRAQVSAARALASARGDAIDVEVMKERSRCMAAVLNLAPGGADLKAVVTAIAEGK